MNDKEEIIKAVKRSDNWTEIMFASWMIMLALWVIGTRLEKIITQQKSIETQCVKSE